MTKPTLTTRYRGTGVTENEVFQNHNGILISLFTYGEAGRFSSAEAAPGRLATHWAGKIYAISPGQGIYTSDFPSTSGVLTHAFAIPDITPDYLMPWQTCWRKGESQIFTIYNTSTANVCRMVFVDGNGNVEESSDINVVSFISNHNPFQTPLRYGNVLYDSFNATSNTKMHIINPGTESINFLQWNQTGVTYPQQDIAIHSGLLYGYTIQSSAGGGLGNSLWAISSAIPYKMLEWDANGGQVANAGQNLIFSDGENLVMMGAGDGTNGGGTDEFGVFKVNFDAQRIPSSVVNVVNTVFGFTDLELLDNARFYATRDIETNPEEIVTYIHVCTGNSTSEGIPFHTYRWNGPNQAATYIGPFGDVFQFDMPHDKLGGGEGSFAADGELSFRITGVVGSGTSLNVSYIIDGIAEPAGVAMCVKQDNTKNSPISLATVTPIDNGFSSGNYIAGLSVGTSGTFTWNLAADEISPGDNPNATASFIRTE